ncbi:MAG TPA: ComF family protein [Bacteroidia bacterium]|nr:ComF family protein [Bacteroidia bacterium]
MKIDFDILKDFLEIVYPKVCIACNVGLFKHETYLCTKCRYTLPRANVHQDIEKSIIRKTLYGRIPVFGSAAYYLFSKKSGVQHILHHIKYKQGKDLAVQVGKWMAMELLTTEWIKDLDGFVPIPLHPKKQLERGYNQSEEYCKGLANIVNKPVLNMLKKDIYTSTQTKKKRMERWENIKNTFGATNESVHSLQHIALVDDVMTTGATLEAAYLSLKNAGFNGKVSIVTIALATHLI